jgi:serine/threonine-protein kinase HipA
MAKGTTPSKQILVFAQWQGMAAPMLMGELSATLIRGKESFGFEYEPSWLASSYAVALDPDLQQFAGPQYPQVQSSLIHRLTAGADC